ncbi:MAG: hypothetical protein QXT19_03825 [Candidatus Woesearchaeota archaeon]
MGGFVRIKKIKGTEYGYLVENTWTAKGSRQKVKAYLGKIIKPVKTNDLPAPELKELSYADSVKAIAKWTLLQHGFQEGSQSMLMNGTVLADLGELRVINKTSPAVIKMHEGFLCTHTLQQAVGFIPSSNTEEIIGKELANVLLEAGLSVPHEIFVQLFEKVHNTYKPNINEGTQ